MAIPFAQLTWTASTGGSEPVVNYKVYRGINGASITFLADVGNVLAYSEEIAAGIPYAYQVRAEDASGGLSVVSNTLVLMTADVPAAPVLSGFFVSGGTGVSSGLCVDFTASGAVDETGSGVAALNSGYTSDGTDVINSLDPTFLTSYTAVVNHGTTSNTFILTAARNVMGTPGDPLGANYFNRITFSIFDGATVHTYTLPSADAVYDNPYNEFSGYFYNRWTWSDVSIIPFESGGHYQITYAGAPSFASLSWTEAASDTPIVSYTIYRGVDGGELTLLTTVPGNVLEHVDPDLASTSIYQYYITAENAAGSSLPSNTITIEGT